MTDADTDAGAGSVGSSRSDQLDVEGEAVFRGEADAEAVIAAIERARHPTPPEEIEADDATHLRALRNHRPETLKLPGFGEPEPDCGEFIPQALRFCVRSGKTHEFKHNCLRYDCPQHAPYAARRRAAGSSDAAGIAPKLKSLQLRLFKARTEALGRKVDHFFHHLFFSIPEDYYTESEEPLERLKEVVREIMDELGIQGVIIYHPFRGADETKDGDDRGFWKDLLFHLTDWDEARERLEAGPHFHIIGVAPHVDVSITEQVEEATGWVIHRRTDDNGISLPNAQAMCNALTYALSHAGIYETASGQRRLAAWVKGPDVNSTRVYPQTKDDMRAAVMEAAEDTLGIASPSLECDCDFHQHTEQVDPAIGDVESGAVSMADAGPLDYTTKPVAEPRAAYGPNPSEIRPGITDLPTEADDLPPEPWDLPPSGSGFGGSTSSPSTSGGGAEEIEGDDDQEESDDGPTCGAYLKHISKAGEYLTSDDWMRNAPYRDDLDAAYRSYIDYMTSRDLDPLDDLPKLAEEANDEPPGSPFLPATFAPVGGSIRNAP